MALFCQKAEKYVKKEKKLEKKTEEKNNILLWQQKKQVDRREMEEIAQEDD